ncbi:MAG: AAA family ATPase [Succinivibrio sp.]|nr:AAA family ATPase [Succinivibrio sp.]
MILNGNKDCFKSILKGEYIDKSMLISYTNSCLYAPANKFICVSRPRGFGKTYVAHMLTAYYSKGCDSHDLFSNLAISKEESYEKYINKFNVITLDIQAMIALNQGVKGVVNFIQKTICKELADVFCDVPFSKDNLVEAIFNIYSKTGQRIIFIIDDYDFLFLKYADEKEEIFAYFNLLRGLFKGAIGDSAVALAYLTGVIPIGRYESQTSLNNFDLISMLNTYRLGKFVGFTGEEVATLCQNHDIDFEKAKCWFGGYHLDGHEVFNPRSIMTLMRTGIYQSQFNETDPSCLIKAKISLFTGLEEDLRSLANGNPLKGIDITRFNNGNSVFSNKDSVIVYLIHLGYLAYNLEQYEVFIPNEDCKRKIIKILED